MKIDREIVVLLLLAGLGVSISAVAYGIYLFAINNLMNSFEFIVQLIFSLIPVIAQSAALVYIWKKVKTRRRRAPKK